MDGETIIPGRTDGISGITPDYRGKVRDIYDLGDRLLLVATDRLSAYDYILPDAIPGKGIVLTQLSLFWLDFFADTVANHLISADVADLPEAFAAFADYLDGRFMLVRKADMFPVECIVRGYLAGSGWKEYEATGQLDGFALPTGLRQGDRLPEPLFTPSTKAEQGEHDQEENFAQLAATVGEDAAAALQRLSVELYGQARDYAAARGIIIADTKFEFGQVDGRIVLADEVLTPDSSRFWPADTWEPGRSQPSFDKQYVRDWLTAHWDFTGEPPRLPAEVIARTAEKYRAAYEQLTGRPFVW